MYRSARIKQTSLGIDKPFYFLIVNRHLLYILFTNTSRITILMSFTVFGYLTHFDARCLHSSQLKHCDPSIFVGQSAPTWFRCSQLKHRFIRFSFHISLSIFSAPYRGFSFVISIFFVASMGIFFLRFTFSKVTQWRLRCEFSDACLIPQTCDYAVDNTTEYFIFINRNSISKDRLCVHSWNISPLC